MPCGSLLSCILIFSSVARAHGPSKSNYHMPLFGSGYRQSVSERSALSAKEIFACFVLSVKVIAS